MGTFLFNPRKPRLLLILRPPKLRPDLLPFHFGFPFDGEMKHLCVFFVAVTVSLATCSAFVTVPSILAGSVQQRSVTTLFMQRRDIINIFTQATILSTASTAVHALDMDSFINNQLERDTVDCNSKLDPKCIPKLTADEALCKYGVSGSDARLTACKRVRDAGGLLPTSKPGERNTAGWVNNPIPL